MRLVTYSRDSSVSCGVMSGSGIVDIAADWKGKKPPRCVVEILKCGQKCLDKVRKIAQNADEVLPLDSMSL